MSKEIKTQVVVLGAGPAGYSAAFRAADLGLDTIIVERYSTLGGVCLNVGCIPSKALLHVAKVIEEAKALAEHGIVFGAPQTDIDKVRLWKEKVINQLTGGLAGMAKMRKVQVVNGFGKFTGPNTLEVEGADGKTTVTAPHKVKPKQFNLGYQRHTHLNQPTAHAHIHNRGRRTAGLAYVITR